MVGKRSRLFGERVYTNRLIIEKMKESDWNFFRTIAGDPIVYQYFGEYQLPKHELKKLFLEDMVKDLNTLYLVVRKHDETPIGFINMYYVVDGKWLVEYALLEPYRSKGYMTEAFVYICKNREEFLQMFNAKGKLIELVFEVANENVGSSKVIKKVSKTCRLHCDTSICSFYKTFESRNGWMWYRLIL